MEFRDYLRIARRRWLLIVSCLVVAVGVAALVTFRATPLYASTTQLFISTPGSDTAQAYQGGLFSQQRVTSYADLVTSRQVASDVLDEVESDLTPTELAEKVTASAVPETVILEIEVSDPAPETAQELAQGYAEVMTGYIKDLEEPAGGGKAPLKATVAEEADLPTAPYSPQPVRNLGLAAVLGLLLGLGLAVMRELLDNRIKTPADVNAIADTPVMSTIPLDPSVEKTPLITDINTHAPRAEAFRVLRTNLQFVDVDSPSKIVAVTSSLPGEGKSSTAMILAIALTQAGQRTLLVDGDLRRPQVAGRLGLEQTVGLTTVLVGKIDLADALQEHAASGLTVLTSGSVPPNPAELIQSHAMEDLLKDLRGQFEVVVIDSPPLLPVTDAALLAAHSDGALIVVRHDKTTTDQLEHSLERLHAVDSRAVGVVINAVPVKRGGSYGYGYGYGYGYAPEEGRRKADPVADKATADS